MSSMDVFYPDPAPQGRSQDWLSDAGCKDTETDVFYPETGPEVYEQTKAALAICRGCPVETECWWDQITSGQEAWGVRGGQKPSDLESSRKAFEAGRDQRPQVEAKQKADQERAEKQAARQAKNRESAARYAKSLRERAAAGDERAVAALQARRQRTNGADQARRVKEREERVAAEREATLRAREEREWAELPEQRRAAEDVAEVA